jgi:hypothetical protein
MKTARITPAMVLNEIGTLNTSKMSAFQVHLMVVGAQAEITSDLLSGARTIQNRATFDCVEPLDAQGMRDVRRTLKANTSL